MIDPGTHNNLLIVAILVMSLLAWLARARPCSCEKCAFHVNEKRMEGLRKAEAADKYREDQERLRHDYEHKGGGFLPGDPDKFACPRDQCPRNPRKKVVD